MPSEQHSQPAAESHPPSYDLVNDPRDYYAPRVRDFEPGSQGTSIREPDAESLLPTYAASAKRWGRYKSEAAYLNALRDFVKQKEFVDGPVDGKGVPVGIIGFYGTKTGADYAAALPPLRDSQRRGKPNRQSAGSNDTNRVDESNNTDRSNGEYLPKPKSGLRQWLRKRSASSSPEN